MARHQWVSSALLATALGVVAGCNDINTGQDQRNGRGNGDELPTTGPATQGTNATAPDVTISGPGSHKVIKSDVPAGVSTPYGGDGAGAAPPVSPAKGGMASGDSNSGQMTNDQKTIGADATTNNASPKANLGGPGTGTPPK